MLKLPDTTRLLLHCIQLQAADTRRAEIASLMERPIDWKAFEEAAIWQGVAPLAFNGLRHVQDRHRIPNWLLDGLKAEYRKNLIHNTILFADLEKIVAALGERAVPVILLKGAAFSRMIYKDLGLRPMSDIDILVKKNDLHQAIQAIEACGYLRHDREDLDQLLKTKYHVVYIHPDTNALVEIHWNITSKRNPSLVRSKMSNLMEWYWTRASNTVTGANHVYHLHPIDLICLVASHFFKHRFVKAGAGFSTHGGMLQLCDIFNIVSYYQDEMTWSELAADADRAGLLKPVSVALFIVKTLFADVIDDPIALFDDLTVDSSDKAIAQQVIQRLYTMPDKNVPVPIEFVRIDKNTSFPHRVANIFRTAFPKPDTLSSRMNRKVDRKWMVLNYVSRFFMLLRKYGTIWFKRRHLKEEAILRRWISEIE